MTPTGRFQADSDALVLENVSPVSTTSPALEHAALSWLSSRGGHSSVGQLQVQTGGSTVRVWSPQPRHVGLLEFSSPVFRVDRLRGGCLAKGMPRLT